MGRMDSGQKDARSGQLNSFHPTVQDFRDVADWTFLVLASGNGRRRVVIIQALHRDALLQRRGEAPIRP